MAQILTERSGQVNDRLILTEKNEGLTFGTDALLLAGYVRPGYRTGVELGAGSGIISMLILTRNKAETLLAVEVQPEFADLIASNAADNSLSDRLTAVRADLREWKNAGDADLVFANPPYMKIDAGGRNLADCKFIARHEVFGTVGDFCRCAGRSLRWGGDFYAVFRPDRTEDLLVALRESGLEPKRLTFVHADTDSEASMLLCEAKRGANGGLFLTPPLILYADKSHKIYSDDMDFILNSGSFPEKFDRKQGGSRYGNRKKQN